MSLQHIQEHVDLIARHEQEFFAQRTSTERAIDSIAGFVGSLPFVVGHLLIFAAWIAWNCAHGTRHWDPFPFSLLSTCVALEALMVASFILMRQARLGRRQDERDHLMLQILLLVEKEMTAALDVERELADHIGLKRVAERDDVKELSEETQIDAMAQTIRESLTDPATAATTQDFEDLTANDVDASE